jgi:hypothetical protein
VDILSRLAALFARESKLKATAPNGFPDPTAHPPPTNTVDAKVADRLLSGIDSIDWSALEHAYGPATTTPEYLRALLSPDESVRGEAVEHLWSAITHQGTVYSATVAATPFLLRILADDAAMPIRATLLSVLEVIAGGSSYHDVHAEFFPADERETAEWQERLDRELADVAGCRREAAAGLDLVLRFVADPALDVRLQATSTAASLSLLPEVSDEARARVQNALRAVAEHDDSHVVRASAVLSLSLLGSDTRRWLAQQSSPIRVAAALSPGLRDDPDAQAILLDALARPEELDALFPDGLPQLSGYPRFTVIATVCDRVPDREAALPALLAALRLASNWTVDVDRAPMLRYFFPPPAQGGTVLSRPQRAFLGALVQRDDLWDPKNGNAMGAFKQVGLPYSRAGIEEVLRSGRLPPA